MQEEQDTCRICSAPAEPDQPLFHPCKCSGTIRYIHQDCLTEWLAHSKKKTCDVCKYPYSFTKVYSKDMPERLPLFLILRQFSQQLVSAVVFGLRTVLVASIWLAALPWVTVWTWRMYFAMGNHAAWWISALKRPEHEPDVFDDVATNTTVANATSSDAASAPPSGFLAHPLVLQVSADIVTGQIIASMIVIAFVAVFLLREWISQNARPGIFEDGDVPVDQAMPDVALPVQEIPLPAPEVEAIPPPALPPATQEEFPHARLPGDKGGYNGAHRDDMNPRTKSKKPRTRDDGAMLGGAREPEIGPIRRRSMHRAQTSRATGKARSRTLRAYDVGGGDEDSDGGWGVYEQKEREFQRLPYVRRMSTSEEAQSEPGPSRPPNLDGWSPGHIRDHSSSSLPPSAEFTFTVPMPSASSSSHSLPYSLTNGENPSRSNGYGEPPARNPFSPPRIHPESSTEDERERTPTSSTPPVAGPSSGWKLDTKMNGQSDDPRLPQPSPSTNTPLGLRRPPLPTITLPPSPAPASASGSAIHSRKHTPLASPSLATYRPPEDLDPNDQNGYFANSWYADFSDADEMEEAHRRYFRDPDEVQSEISEAEREAEEERAEMAEMADGELDGDMEDDIEDLQWTDEEIVVEDEEDEEEEEEGLGQGEEEADQQDEGEGEEEADVVPEAGAVQRLEPPPPAPEDFENDVNIEDDMDGALEAIGLRGPLYGVLQNAILMTFILDTTIGLGIWLPFTIGKTTALLTLNPRRALQIVHLPLRVIRLVTDPIVDTVLLFFSRLLVVPLTALAQFIMAQANGVVSSLAGADRAEKLADTVSSWYGRAVELTTRATNSTASASPSEATHAESTSTYLYRLLEQDSTFMRVVEPYFAPLGKNIRQWSAQGKETWIDLAVGDETPERVFAICLGYAVVGLVLAIYLNVLTVGTMKNAGRAVRSAIRQQLLVVKVAAFIVIELIIFPLGCGMMLDVCSVWMFPHGTFRSRAAFLLFAPLRATFYHWVLGTMFMYQFAVLLSGCRGIMRPGAMWFIKDPQDQNFHPIRDILERPTLVQLRKLLLSATMYGVVVASGVATVSGILRLFRGTIMPFRWKIREPLSEIPIDLIFIQLVLPYTLEYFRPRKALRRFGTFVWRYFARQLRLSSYMFGGRYPSEEYTPKHWSRRSLLIDDGIEMDDAEAVHDGTFRRVPNSDNVVLIKDSPATVEVDEEGYPLTAEGRRLILAQDAETEKAKRSVKEDYTIVYIPPLFKYRVVAFLLAIWTVGSVMLATIIAAPILLGRSFFRLFLPYEVHDGYSFIVGFYLLWGCWLVGTALDRMDKRRQRRWSDRPRAEWPLFVAKRALLWVAQATYMLATLGVLVPTLLGLVIELYIVLPIKHAANPLMEPRIRMADMWALGLLYGKIIVRVMRVNQPTHGLMHGVDRIVLNGWTHMDPMRATTEVIAPVSAGLLGMILLPAGALWTVQRMITLPMDGDFLFLHVYPGLFTLAGLGHAAWVLSRVAKSWSQTIRDKEFLVEMRLRNLEEQEAANGDKAGAPLDMAPAAEVEVEE